MKKSLFASLCLTASFLLAACNGGKKDPPVEKNDGSLEKPFNVVEAIQECDDAGANTVVNYECYVTGTFEQGTEIDKYGRWSGIAKMDGKELHLDSLTVPETMKIAPENGRLDGKKFIVQGYLELYEGVYKLGYLPASASPTNEKYNPVIYSIEGKTDYENYEGYETPINGFVAKFSAGSNVTFPELPDADYEAYININKWGVGYTLEGACADNHEPGEAASFEEIYKAKLEAADWVNTNTEEYTYEEYGYFYQDKGANYEIQFFTYDDAFSFSISELKANYKGKCCELGSDEEFDWFEYYVEEYGYEYSKTFPTAALAELCGVEESVIPAFDLPSGCIYYCDPGDEEYDPYIEIDLFGCDLDQFYDYILDECDYTFTLFGDISVTPFDRSFAFEFVESWDDDFGYILYFYNINDYFCTSLTEDTEWNVDYIEMISSITGSTHVIPFMQLGEDYALYADESSLYIYDTYMYDLTGEYNKLLVANGYELVNVYDEEYDEFFPYYVQEFADGTIVTIETYWSNGNSIYVTAERPAEEIVLTDEEVSIKAGKTYQIEYSFGPENCIEPEDEVTFASDYEKVTVDAKGLVTVAADAEVGHTANITVTCGALTAKLVVTVADASAQESGWVKVTDVSDLEAGDKIVFANEAAKVINAAPLGNNKGLDVASATFDSGKITSEVPNTSIITLGGTVDSWTFVLGELTLASNGEKNMVGGDCSTWTIDFDKDGNALIQPTTHTNVTLYYNPSSPRFTNYKAASETAVAIQLYVFAD